LLCASFPPEEASATPNSVPDERFSWRDYDPRTAMASSASISDCRISGDNTWIFVRLTMFERPIAVHVVLVFSNHKVCTG
jgi:hypothetical protein